MLSGTSLGTKCTWQVYNWTVSFNPPEKVWDWKMFFNKMIKNQPKLVKFSSSICQRVNQKTSQTKLTHTDTSYCSRTVTPSQAHKEMKDDADRIVHICNLTSHILNILRPKQYKEVEISYHCLRWKSGMCRLWHCVHLEAHSIYACHWCQLEEEIFKRIIYFL